MLPFMLKESGITESFSDFANLLINCLLSPTLTHRKENFKN